MSRERGRNSMPLEPPKLDRAYLPGNLYFPCSALQHVRFNIRVIAYAQFLMQIEHVS